MLLSLLLFIPLLGVFLLSGAISFKYENTNILYSKCIASATAILNCFVSLVIYIIFDFSTNQFQLVQEQYEFSFFDVYLGIDGISIYFVLLTTIIMPIALISN